MAEIREILPESIGEGIHLEPNKVLESAHNRLSEAVVIGLDIDGNPYVASTEGAIRTLGLIETAKFSLLAP